MSLHLYRGRSAFGGNRGDYRLAVSDTKKKRKRRKILVCAYACSPPGGVSFRGGEELLGWRLIQQLARFHRVDVLVSAEHEESLTNASTPAGVRYRFVDLPAWLHPLKKLQGGVQSYAYLWQFKAWWVARRLHDRHSYDLFHHVTYANDWMASHTGALLDDVPFVRGPGGGAHRVPRPLLANYGWRFRWSQRLRSLAQKLFRHDPFFVRGQRRASALLVCTRESLEAIPARRREKAALMPVVGVADELFEVEPADDGSDGLRVLSAGKLLPHKGFDLAIRAFALAFPEDSSARLSVAGEGPEAENLRRLVESLGVQGRVHFEGWTPRDRLLQAMAAADIFLFPSLRDGGGAVVVEAMAAATPVICLDTAGPGLHVTESTGISVAPGPAREVVRSLASGLEALAGDPERRRTLGAAARRRAWRRYRWSTHGDRIAEIHDAVLSSGGDPLELATYPDGVPPADESLGPPDGDSVSEQRLRFRDRD